MTSEQEGELSEVPRPPGSDASDGTSEAPPEPAAAVPAAAVPAAAEPAAAEPARPEDGAAEPATDGESVEVEAGATDHELTEDAAASAEDGSAEETLDVSVPGDLFAPIEAILLVVDEPLSPVTLAQVLARPRPEIEEALRALSESYTKEGRGFDLREIAGGWRLYTREEYAEVVERFVLDGQQARLTQAALETLAVIAYRQPVSRTRVSAIRGVNCDGVVRTLLTRGLVEEAGADGESGATLYRTTTYFLERLGIGTLEELPSLAPYLPEIDEMDAETMEPPTPPSPPVELPLDVEPDSDAVPMVEPPEDEDVRDVGGDEPTGDEPTGDEPTGDEPTGDEPTEQS